MPKAERPKWEEELEKLIERKWRHGTPIEYSLDEEELIEVKSFIQKTIDSEVEAREKEIEEAMSDFHFLNGLGNASYKAIEQEAFENGVFQTVRVLRDLIHPKE